jgi:5-formyltetrahydrofolate cyclo-ligase
MLNLDRDYILAVYASKKSIRKEVLHRRNLIDEETKRYKDRKIRELLTGLPEFIQSHAILLYASFRSEVDTTVLIEYCLAAGKVAVLPKVAKVAKVAKVDSINSRLRLYEIKDIKELSSGYYGIPEPDVPEDRGMRAEDMDLIVVPGVAFGEDCSRLGYGKGFYDKLLSEVRSQKPALSEVEGSEVRFIGLAYEEQVVKSIPSESHDIKMDKIITDKRIIEC